MAFETVRVTGSDISSAYHEADVSIFILPLELPTIFLFVE